MAKNQWQGLLLAGILALPLAAAGLPAARPEEVGLSAERLKRIHQAIQRHIDAGEISGAVTLVARRGRIAHFEAHGLMDLEAKKPMAKDAIFRMASMSKPVTAVAVLMMVEEGKIRLSDPVSRFLPEFKDAKVAMPRAGGGRGSAPPEIYTVPADREITIRDLLTHTLGADERRNRATGGPAAGAPIRRRHARELRLPPGGRPARLPTGDRVGLQRRGRSRCPIAHRGDRLRSDV